MQTHIITLADPRYLEYYLDEMRRYTIDGNLRTQEMLRRFFIDSFSPYVLASYRQYTIAAATLSTKQERELDREERGSYRRDIQALQDIIPMELYESMRVHLIQISAIFSQHSFYEITRDVITPFIETCMRQEWEFDEWDDQSNQDAIQELKSELDEYDSYTPTTRKLYDEYIELFDKKYGMFYRRNLQLLVRDELSMPSSLRWEYDRVFIETGWNHSLTRDIVLSNMSVFLDYPDVALLFLIEKIIAGQDIIREDETIDMVAERYQLQTLIERDAILFTALLYERGESHDDAMDYIVSIPDILDVPQVLSMLMEWLRYMDDSQRIDTLLWLDQVIQTEYDAKDFFEQVEIIADDTMNTGDASDVDQAYMLMAIAHMQIIQDKDYHQVKVWLSTAWELGLPIWYIASGDISQEVGDIDEAIRLFTLAHLAQPDIISIRRLIGCLIEGARFDEAQMYIDIALREGYNISGFILAWHLYQWNVRQSIEQMVHIIQSDGQMNNTMPEGCMELLSDTIDQLLADNTNTQDINGLKILASYINISMSIESDEPDPVDYIVHMDYIESMMNSYEWDDLPSTLYYIIWVLISGIDLDHKESTTDKLSALLHIHFSHMHASLVRIYINNQNTKNIEGTKSSFSMINEFVGRAIFILQHFPQTEEYLRVWRSTLNLFPTQHHLDETIYPMPETVQ